MPELDRRPLARQRPCFCCERPAPSHAHHVTYGRGKGQKVPDSEVIPLCWRCHSELHGYFGHFEGWTREQREEWQRSALLSLWHDGEDVF